MNNVTGIIEKKETNYNKTTMNTSENQSPIFPKGERTSPDYFMGPTWLYPLVAKDETGTFTAGSVSFEPGSRTNWHTHPLGQILIIIDGHGYYQEKGKPARTIVKGDVVMIPSHVEHWHGAAKDSSMTHIAITNIGKQGPVNWLAPVSEEEYNNI
jgi:quercetin dioxygenase-like cupin family protein